jgi:hypothetical protein
MVAGAIITIGTITAGEGESWDRRCWLATSPPWDWGVIIITTITVAEEEEGVALEEVVAITTRELFE